MMRIDGRVPLIVCDGAEALRAALDGAAAAVLVGAHVTDDLDGFVAIERFDPVAAHSAGCACCGNRSSAAQALDRLFLARVTGRCAWFARVLALGDTAETAAAVRAAVGGDAVVAARFRLG